jgi:hypothetical protein
MSRAGKPALCERIGSVIVRNAWRNRRDLPAALPGRKRRYRPEELNGQPEGCTPTVAALGCVSAQAEGYRVF